MANKTNKRVYLSPDNNTNNKNTIKIVNNDSEIITVENKFDPNTQPVVKITDDKSAHNPIDVKVVQNTAPNIDLRRFRSRNHRATGRRGCRYKSRISRIRRFTLPPTSAGPTMPPTKPPKETDSSPTLINKKKLP